MRVRIVRSSFVLGLLAIASCTVGVDDDSPSDGAADALIEDGLGSSQQSIAKGNAGALNGATDYCNNAASPCGLGEGDCDSNAQCAPGMGLICVADNGPKFGFAEGWDVCAGSHCANGTIDGDETSVDCGGSCGTCPTCVGAPGAANFCDNCLCSSGQGDCDSSAECAAGLACGTDNGPVFGLPTGYDVCVAPHCTNGTLDAADGETSIDEGGACGTRGSCNGTLGATDYCFGCKCASGEGDCDSNAECGSGLTCAVDNGPKFGLPAGYDVCVPPHCTNRRKDTASGETGVDVGGPCEAPASNCGNGAVDSGEVCDDGLNDGVLCSSDCTAQPEVAQVRWDCDSGAGIITGLWGTECISFPGAGASYITFSSTAVEVTLFSNGDCTGQTRTVSSELNFCGNVFDQGAGMNDNVNSALVRRLN
jgi:hypothetical protein